MIRGQMFRMVEMTYVLGVTGSFGSGKTTVGGMFREFGAVLIDADMIAREVVSPDSSVMDELAAVFGKGILTEDYRLDRHKLADLVFGDPDKTSQLNAIIHPGVRKEMEQRIAMAGEDVPMLVLDVPLLFESGMQDMVDGIAVVVTDETSRMERLKARGVDSREVERRLRHQMPQSEKARQADFIIDNTGNIEKTHMQVKNLFESIGATRP
jgi:dephospho-CoA kinase